jgi:hypothetical protein
LHWREDGLFYLAMELEIMTPEDLNALHQAKTLLENPGWAIKMTALIGTPLEKGMDLLPAKWSGQVNRSVRVALEKALRVAAGSLSEAPGRRSAERTHTFLAAAGGGVGGIFGLPGLMVELPISTVIMLRSIAEIARSEGESIRDPETLLSCLQVFALGGRSRSDNAAESGYFAMRALLARSLQEAAQHIAAKGLSQKGAPVLVRFIGQIASRFGVVIGEKAAAQALPLLGAAGGVMINTVFIHHFQDTARGHFTVRRLERLYGAERIAQEYAALAV